MFVWQSEIEGIERVVVGASLVAFFIVFLIKFGALVIAIKRKLLPDNSISEKAKKRIETEGVTVLKPLKGHEDQLEDSLESFFHLDYPKFELIFSVDSPDDPARLVAEKLIQKYPNVDAKITISDRINCRNPKINNLLIAYKIAKYNITWQSDSNIAAQRHVLKNLVAKLDDDVGLVHQVPVIYEYSSFGSMLETCYLNSWHSSMYLFINYTLDTHCVVGKSLLFRKSLLEKLGGILQYGDYLAEDFFLSLDIMNAKFKLILSPDPALQNLKNMSFLEHCRRFGRWMRLRHSLQPLPSFLEMFTYLIINCPFSYYGFYRFFGLDITHFFILHILTWVLTDFIQMWLLTDMSLLNLLALVPAYFFREILTFPLIIWACSGSTVMWRGKLYRLTSQSRFVDAEPIEKLKKY